MDIIIDEFLKSYKSQLGISKLTNDELETYIANEIIDEEGNVLIELPEPIYYDNSIRESIYKYRNRNREDYNSRAREYHNNKMKDPEARAYHNARCKEYNKKRRDRLRLKRSNETSFIVKFE